MLDNGPRHDREGVPTFVRQSMAGTTDRPEPTDAAAGTRLPMGVGRIGYSVFSALPVVSA